jgi:hypothetical protein
MVMDKNDWIAKVYRTFTSVLPVSSDRVGSCINCGKCCVLPNKCMFLKFRPDNTSYCSINSFKPLNCRKYPRAKSEFLTAKTCGFRFKP